MHRFAPAAQVSFKKWHRLLCTAVCICAVGGTAQAQDYSGATTRAPASLGELPTQTIALPPIEVQSSAGMRYGTRGTRGSLLPPPPIAGGSVPKTLPPLDRVTSPRSMGATNARPSAVRPLPPLSPLTSTPDLGLRPNYSLNRNQRPGTLSAAPLPPLSTSSSTRIAMPQRYPATTAGIVRPQLTQQPMAPAVIAAAPLAPLPDATPKAAPAPVQEGEWVTLEPQPATAAAPAPSAVPFGAPTPPPAASEPVAAVAAIAPASPETSPVHAEFDAIVKGYGAPVPAEPVIADVAPTTDVTPQPAPEVPAATAATIPVATLSDESRAILDKLPKTADGRTVIKTPEPVIIKRTDPNAGVLPSNVKTHEEVGMSIEVRASKTEVFGLLEEGYDALMSGNYSGAEQAYQGALSSEADNELALFGLATTYHKQGNLEQARAYYGKLLTKNPYHREGLNNFMALVSQEAPEQALAELEKLELANPDFSPIPAQIGLILNQQGDLKAAAGKLARALELEPGNLSYQYNLAVTLDRMGDAPQALALYQNLLEAHLQGQALPGDVDIDTIHNRAIYLGSHGA